MKSNICLGVLYAQYNQNITLLFVVSGFRTMFWWSKQWHYFVISPLEHFHCSALYFPKCWSVLMTRNRFIYVFKEVTCTANSYCKICFDQCVYSLPSDRHKSFKLRLPSIRRDLRRKSADVENPVESEEEEAVPLQRIGPIPSPSPSPMDRLHPPLSSPLLDKRPLDRELSDISNWSNEDFKSRKSSQGSLRRASSMEHLNSSLRSPASDKHRIKAATVSSGGCGYSACGHARRFQSSCAHVNIWKLVSCTEVVSAVKYQCANVFDLFLDCRHSQLRPVTFLWHFNNK